VQASWLSVSSGQPEDEDAADEEEHSTSRGGLSSFWGPGQNIGGPLKVKTSYSDSRLQIKMIRDKETLYRGKD